MDHEEHYETRGRHSAVPRCNKLVQELIKRSLDVASKRRPLAAELAESNARILDAALPQLVGEDRARAIRNRNQLRAEAHLLRLWGVRV